MDISGHESRRRLDTCRRILCFPRGNGRPGAGTISAFLDCGDPASQPPNWTRRAAFKLCLVNQRDPARNITKGAGFAHSICAVTCILLTSSPAPASTLAHLMQSLLTSSQLARTIGASLSLPTSQTCTPPTQAFWSTTPYDSMSLSESRSRRSTTMTAKRPRAMLV